MAQDTSSHFRLIYFCLNITYYSFFSKNVSKNSTAVPNLTLDGTNIRSHFNALLSENVIRRFANSKPLINEAPLYEVMYDSLKQLEQQAIPFLTKGSAEYNKTTSLLKHFKRSLTLSEHVGPLIRKHAPHLIMSDLNEDFDNSVLKKKIHEYRLSDQDSPQDGLFHFLSAMITMYRTGLNPQPLKIFLQALSNDSYLHKRLKARLRDDAERESGEHWSTGNHEWLPCHLIQSILERSAGMHAGYEAFIVQEKQHKIEIIDWLSLHRQFRSSVKRIYFLNEENTLVSGHVPAIRDRLEGHPNEGSQVSGTKAYHGALEDAFKTHKTLNDFVRQCRHIEKAHLIRGKKPITPSSNRFFTVEGHATHQKIAMSQLRSEKISPAYHERKALMALLEQQTRHKGVLPRVPSLSSTDTLISESPSDHHVPKKPIKTKPIRPLPKKDSLSSYSSTWSYILEEEIKDDVPEPDKLETITLPSAYLEIVEGVLFTILTHFNCPKSLMRELSSLFTKLRASSVFADRKRLSDEIDARLSLQIKQQFIMALDELYTGGCINKQNDIDLLYYANQIPYLDLIRLWFDLKEDTTPTIKAKLSREILLSVPLSGDSNDYYRRAHLQSQCLVPFYLSHAKLGDGREGDLHRKISNELITKTDVKRLIEESHNISRLYNDSQHRNVVADYFDLKSAYEALYIAISLPSKRYTRKEGLFSRCCPGLFSRPGPRAHLSQLAQRHLKLVKTAFIDSINALITTIPKESDKALLTVIKNDIRLEDHFINQKTNRHDPYCCIPKKTNENSIINRLLDSSKRRVP